MKAREIRQKFLDFFSSKAHMIVPSGPIVLKDDPSLMFTNAGMNQFKDIFLGNEQPRANRVADTQKCLRVSGKHNDLEEVGHDTYHHTMFEMLGNWSFGDYFKKEAVQWAWELLVDVYKLPENRLYVTYFSGNKKDGLDADEETHKHWSSIVNEAHILSFGKEENFWEMGNTGPCGPSSEIHIDLRNEAERKKTPGSEMVNRDHPKVIELWNLVFMEYNRFKDGHLEPLPQKHVDTGLGLERLAAILQGSNSNYRTDLFQPLIKYAGQKSGFRYGEDKKVDTALCVVSDHCRAIAFAIADGQLPSNTGAGYVIRRILRRAVRYGHQYLKAQKPFLYEMVTILSQQFKAVFPEISEQKEFVQRVIREEENSFLKTLSTGSRLFEQKARELEKSGKDVLPGDFTFLLYDTYGFPLDLSRLMAREKNLQIDEKGFNKALEQQRSRSRKAARKEESDWQIIREDRRTQFAGYDQSSGTVRLTRYRKVKTTKKELYHLVFDQTPFYAESGGQIGDTGILRQNSTEIPVLDTIKENKLTLHVTEKLPPDFQKPLEAIVDEGRRNNTAKNHTATHLLHAALRKVLGDHVTQQGSLVAPNHLRFDFSHFSRVSNEELREIEHLVNQKIQENITRKEQRNVLVEEALKEGATALFGEKYGERVRVITFDDKFSKELCGGIHVNATGQIGFFKIISETAVAAGIRRIEAVTGPSAIDYLEKIFREYEELKEVIKKPQNPIKAVRDLVKENKAREKEIEKLKREKVNSIRNELLKETETIEGFSLLTKKVELDSPALGKELVFEIQNQLKDAIILLGAGFSGKANLWLAIPQTLAEEKSLNAGTMIKEMAREIKGGGGGKAFFATAGGKDAGSLDKAIEKGKNLILEKLH